MVKLVFLRHCTKLYDNGKPVKNYNGGHMHAHDPPLKDNQEDLVKEKLTKLKEKYGKPKMIYVSPFLRTRQTADMVSRFFDNTPITFDIRLKEFLGWQKPKNSPAELENITKAYMGGDLLGVEKIIHVENRVEDFLKSLPLENDEIYYIITHGIVIAKACKYYKNKKDRFEDFCGVFLDVGKDEVNCLEYI